MIGRPPRATRTTTLFPYPTLFLAQADLSAMTSRQPICEVGDDGRAVPLFYELFTSIGALRQTLMPDQNLFSDRWLFQYLTGKLDQRMLAWLSKNDDSTLRH